MLMDSVLRTKILAAFRETAEDFNLTLSIPLSDSTPLLDCGLDSLAFATLIARLEETLGYDPFSQTADPLYPQTVGDFIHIYEQAGQAGEAARKQPLPEPE